MRPALTVTDLRKAYGATQALDGVSLTVERGTIHALLGGNGSGKSTLVKILAGVVKADSGKVAFGEDVLQAKDLDPAAAHAADCYFVHQDAGVFLDLSVADNLHLGYGFARGWGGRIRWKAIRRRTREVLDLYEIDADPDTLVGELSPATRTKVAIGRVLQGRSTADSGVLVLDEPTASLPATEVEPLLSALAQYAAAGQAIVLVTHRLAEVCAVADAATVLRNGRVLSTLTSHEMTTDRLTDLIATDGIPLTVERSARPPAGSSPVLSVRELSGGAVAGVSLTVGAGEIVGLAGLIGSGTSCLLETLFGLSPRESGVVEVDGRVTRLQSPRDAMSAGIAYVPADRKAEGMFADLSVSQNLAMAVVSRYWQHGRLSSRAEQADSRALIETYGIKAESEHLPMSALSGGNQQKVMLARWLRRKPRLLLLDEPTQGVDVGARSAIHNLIREVVADGVGALIASSDEDELATICDRVIVVRDGRICDVIGGDAMTAERIARLTHSQELVT